MIQGGTLTKHAGFSRQLGRSLNITTRATKSKPTTLLTVGKIKQLTTMNNMNDSIQRLERDVKTIELFNQDPEFRLNFMHQYGLTEDQAYEEMKLMRVCLAHELFGYDAS
jgi:hypothetical protein